MQVDAVLSDFGRVDCCIANAGVGGWASSFLDIDLD